MLFCFRSSKKHIKQQNEILKRIATALEDLVKLKRLELRPAKPGKVNYQILQEGDNNMLQYKLVLPALDQDGDNDVTLRRLTVNGVVTEVAPDQTEVTGLEGEQDSTVEGTLVDLDDATPPNESAPRAFSFVLSDTVPPPMPGEVGLVVEGEV